MRICRKPGPSYLTLLVCKVTGPVGVSSLPGAGRRGHAWVSSCGELGEGP